MTPALRKYHLIFWTGSFFLLPLLFIASIMSIPDTAKQISVLSFENEALPDILRKRQDEALSFALRADPSDSIRQLEVLVHKPLSIPEALLYMQDEHVNDHTPGIFIGKLSSAGRYRFSLGTDGKEEPLVIYLFDPFSSRIHSTYQL